MPSLGGAGFNLPHTAGKDTTIFSETDHKRASPVVSKINEVLVEELDKYPLLKDGINRLLNLIHHPELLELAVKSIPLPPLSSATSYHSSHEDRITKNSAPSPESPTSVACLQEGLDTASLTVCTATRPSNDITTGLDNLTHIPREKPSIAADRRAKKSALVTPTPRLLSDALGVFSKNEGEEELVEEAGVMLGGRVGRGGTEEEEEGRRGEFKRELEIQQEREEEGEEEEGEEEEEEEEEEVEEEDLNELRLHSTAVQCSGETDVVAVPTSTAVSYTHRPPSARWPITTTTVLHVPKKSKYIHIYYMGIILAGGFFRGVVRNLRNFYFK